MTLIEKIKENGKRLALAGLLGISGCGPALMGIGAAGAVRGDALGVAVQAFGAGVTQLEAAEKGKTQVNVNANQTGNSGQEAKQIVYIKVPEENDVIQNAPIFNNYFFECNNYIGDLNNNLCDLNNFIGIKNIFSKNEQITFVFGIARGEGLLQGTIWDKERKEIVKNISSNINNQYNNRYRIGATPYSPNSFKPGKYVISWEMGNEVLGTRQFEITE